LTIVVLTTKLRFMDLQKEIKQTKPFSSKAQEAFLSILKTSDKIESSAALFLKGFNLTLPQHNVLRILKGAGPEGWSCSEISLRMIKKDSDITRLLDRLEKPGYIVRIPDKNDRRSIRCQITPKGLELVAKVEPALKNRHALLHEKLGDKKLQQLIHLLEEVRILSDY